MKIYCEPLSWIYTTFKPYCHRIGINLMRDDLKFIERTLIDIPINARRKVMHDYTKEWLQESSEGAGRRRANSFLRQFKGH